ncbi:MAG: hypothetical protein RL173_460 [Fibrobacterota bacterium]|jgi:Kef-type K+ transport system membrane component KefB
MIDPLSSLALLSAAFLLSTLLHRGLARWGVPGILLELVIGFGIGTWIATPAEVGSILGAAELGVLVLFCLVGLETDFRGILQFRGSVLRVAAISVTVSSLGFLLLRDWFHIPAGEPLIIAATIMTSGTGMAMRVLRDHRLVDTPSGKVLLGASVLDDFPAILLLSVAFGISKGGDLGSGSLNWGYLSWLLPLVSAGVVLFVIRFREQLRFRPVHAVPLLVLGAWASHQWGLTALVGALLVGISLRGEKTGAVETYLTPFSQFLIPLYFITVGMRVPLAALVDPDSWVLGVGLFALALVGRLVCTRGIGARDIVNGVDPWLVMWGMVPRGLPGLVFATMAHEARLLSDTSFFGLVLMVTLTNLIGLAGLSWRAKRVGQKLFSGI